MSIHPISGGVAPLYKPLRPSFLIACSRQSRGPLNCAFSLVCNLTLIVSNLYSYGTPAYISNGKGTYGWPTKLSSAHVCQAWEKMAYLTTQLRNTREHACHKPLVVVVLSISGRLPLSQRFIASMCDVGIDDSCVYT